MTKTLQSQITLLKAHDLWPLSAKPAYQVNYLKQGLNLTIQPTGNTPAKQWTLSFDEGDKWLTASAVPKAFEKFTAFEQNKVLSAYLRYRLEQLAKNSLLQQSQSWWQEVGNQFLSSASSVQFRADVSLSNWLAQVRQTRAFIEETMALPQPNAVPRSQLKSLPAQDKTHNVTLLGKPLSDWPGLLSRHQQLQGWYSPFKQFFSWIYLLWHQVDDWSEAKALYQETIQQLEKRPYAAFPLEAILQTPVPKQARAQAEKVPQRLLPLIKELCEKASNNSQKNKALNEFLLVILQALPETQNEARIRQVVEAQIKLLFKHAQSPLRARYFIRQRRAHS